MGGGGRYGWLCFLHECAHGTVGLSPSSHKQVCAGVFWYLAVSEQCSCHTQQLPLSHWEVLSVLRHLRVKAVRQLAHLQAIRTCHDFLKSAWKSREQKPTTYIHQSSETQTYSIPKIVLQIQIQSTKTIQDRQNYFGRFNWCCPNLPGISTFNSTVSFKSFLKLLFSFFSLHALVTSKMPSTVKELPNHPHLISTRPVFL